jgi:hypothetical protein
MKYYTPEIEEFHLGFECEAIINSKMFLPLTMNGVGQDVVQYHRNDVYRVKYLDQEDIESFGFKLHGKAVCKWYRLEGMFDDGFASYGKWTKIQLLHCDDGKIKILAYEFSWEEKESVLFQGQVKNKSELKKILKQIGI